jgi:hypothetical protein
MGIADACKVDTWQMHTKASSSLAFVSGMDDKTAPKLYGAGTGVEKRRNGSLSATATSALAAKPLPCRVNSAAARHAAFMAHACPSENHKQEPLPAQNPLGMFRGENCKLTCRVFKQFVQVFTSSSWTPHNINPLARVFPQ